MYKEGDRCTWSSPVLQTSHRSSLSVFPFLERLLPKSPTFSPSMAKFESDLNKTPHNRILFDFQCTGFVSEESDGGLEKKISDGSEAMAEVVDETQGGVGDSILSMYIDMDKIHGLPVYRKSSSNGTERISPDSSEGEKEKEEVESLNEGTEESEADGEMPKEGFPFNSGAYISFGGAFTQGFMAGQEGQQANQLPALNGKKGGDLHCHSIDGSLNVLRNGEFSPAELRKIMDNEKLAKIALLDPKRIKRILANRQSAARSKEKKMRYISELERKVQALQTEATALSAQLTLLQKDSAGLANENIELKLKLQAMEQQAQLRDALNDAMRVEVHRLRLVTGEMREPRMPFNQKLLLIPQHVQQQGSHCTLLPTQNHHYHSHEQKCQQQNNSQNPINATSGMMHSIMNSFMKAEGPRLAVNQGNSF